MSAIYYRRLGISRALMSAGVVPALFAASLAIVGIGSLYFLNSGGVQPSHQADFQADNLVGDAVTEYPGPGPINVQQPSVVTEGHPQSAARQVQVRPGDTLRTLARTYLGSDQQVGRLVKANPQLGNIDRIYPGEMLNLPAAGAISGDPRIPAEFASDWRQVSPDSPSTDYDGE